MKSNKICGVYKITSPTGRIYIGKSVNIKSRICSYKTLKCPTQKKLYASLKKWGWDAHKFEILIECKEKDLNKFEIKFIKEFKSYYQDNKNIGMNLTKGGDGQTGRVTGFPVHQYSKDGDYITSYPNVSLAAKSVGGSKCHIRDCCKGIRKSSNGFMWSRDKVDKMPPFVNDRNRKWSVEERADRSANSPWLGRKHSEESKKKLSETRKKLLSEGKISCPPKQWAIECYLSTGEIVYRFKSRKEAAKFLKIGTKSVSEAVEKGTELAGYFWRTQQL